MSTQLILYPQNYTGYSYNTDTVITEFVSNPNFTNAFTGTPQLGTGNGAYWASSVMVAYPPIPNWQGLYSKTGSDNWFNATSAPSISPATGTLTLNGTSAASSKGSYCGLYQEVVGLTVGQSYDLIITHFYEYIYH